MDTREVDTREDGGGHQGCGHRGYGHLGVLGLRGVGKVEDFRRHFSRGFRTAGICVPLVREGRGQEGEGGLSRRVGQGGLGGRVRQGRAGGTAQEAGDRVSFGDCRVPGTAWCWK